MCLNWGVKMQLTPFTVAQDKDQAIPVAVQSKAWVYDRSLAGLSGSNPTACFDVGHLRVLRVVMYRSLRQADH
jgi:hypothetical protein